MTPDAEEVAKHLVWLHWYMASSDFSPTLLDRQMIHKAATLLRTMLTQRPSVTYHPTEVTSKGEQK